MSCFVLVGRDNIKTDIHTGAMEGRGRRRLAFFNKNGVGVHYTFFALIFPRPGWKGVLKTGWAAHAPTEAWPGLACGRPGQ